MTQSTPTDPPAERRMSALRGNSQRLDGGAMFGNAPKALWTRWITPDDKNRIPLACRCLLIEEAGGRRVLFETGIGAFFEPKLKDRFAVVETEHVLLGELAALGLSPNDIDIVVLSHLHFDHAGGLLSAYAEDETPTLLFDNARYVTSEAAWARANAPHPRDRASFLPDLNRQLEASGRLVLVDGASDPALGEGYRFHYSDGHTPGLLLTEIDMPDGPVLFCGDLIPGAPWVHLPITMGYDRYPEQLIDEKAALLPQLLARDARLFFTHDASHAYSHIGQDERGRFFARDPQDGAQRIG